MIRAALLAVLLAAPAAALTADRLAPLIAGRVAGPPVACIDPREIETTHLIAGTGFVLTMRTGGTIYLNRVTTAQSFVHDGVTPRFVPAAARLCSGERVELLNENSRAPVATARLGDFIPYRKP
ncbi:MAG: hypothetical protein JO290_06660 [Sphingomonadaceae bacterium]|nr:hypothetical protein [Sphingomonadaceae bacterium]